MCGESRRTHVLLPHTTLSEFYGWGLWRIMWRIIIACTFLVGLLIWLPNQVHIRDSRSVYDSSLTCNLPSAYVDSWIRSGLSTDIVLFKQCCFKLYPFIFIYVDFIRCALTKEENYCINYSLHVGPTVRNYVISKSARRKSLIVLMLLISGNVLPNPGPYNRCVPIYTTPTELRSRSGLVLIHVNVRNLLPKLDMVNIWARNTNADVIIISESWLNKTILDKEISITGYNVFRADRPKRGGGGGGGRNLR